MDPQVSKVKEDGDILTFRLSGLNVCFANSIRRIIVAEIPTIVFKTMPYDKNTCTIFENTTKLNNEILKQRLSCIPIHISDLATPIDKLLLELNVHNTSDTIQVVTTKDFKIKHKDTNAYLSDTDTRKIFPPYIGPGSSSEYYIDFVKLSPKISDNILGNKIHLECQFSISNAKDDSLFNVVSVCSYGNTLDDKTIEEVLRAKLIGWKDEGKTNEELNFETQNWKTLEAKRIYIADSFDFMIQSLGVYENKDLVKKSCAILEDKLIHFLDALQNDDLKIVNSLSTIENCYDISVADDYFEIGGILKHVLYTDYYESDEKMLTYIGFKKMHPHDDESLLRIAFDGEQHGHNTIINIIENSTKKIIKIFQKISKLF